MTDHRSTETAWLDAGRMLAVAAVVVLHVSGSVVTQGEFGSSAWWAGNLYDAATRWSVPVFVMISGALLLDERRSEGAGHFYRRRVARILVPLVFWTVVFVAWTAVRTRGAGDEYDIGDAVEAVVSGKPYFHLWYLYMLVGLYLVTPVVRVIVRGYSRRTLWLFTAAAFALSAVDEFRGATYNNDDELFLTWFVPFLGYFVAGHLIATSNRRVGWLVPSLAVLVSAAATAAGCFLRGRAEDPQEGLYFYGYLSVTVIPMAIAVMWTLKSLTFGEQATRRLSRFAASALGVYLVHPLFLDTLRMRVRLVDLQPWVSIPAAAALIFAASLLVVGALRSVPLLRRTV